VILTILGSQSIHSQSRESNKFVMVYLKVRKVIYRGGVGGKSSSWKGGKGGYESRNHAEQGNRAKSGGKEGRGASGQSVGNNMKVRRERNEAKKREHRLWRVKRVRRSNLRTGFILRGQVGAGRAQSTALIEGREPQRQGRENGSG